jgi:hypothetical protein
MPLQPTPEAAPGVGLRPDFGIRLSHPAVNRREPRPVGKHTSYVPARKLVAVVPMHSHQDDFARKPGRFSGLRRNIAHASPWGNDVSDISMVKATDPYGVTMLNQNSKVSRRPTNVSTFV